MQTIANEDMHAPARFWGETTDLDRDPAAVEQAMRLCKLPLARAAAFLGNLSQDTGFPVGTVFAADGYVIPHGLSADLGCGMAAACTSVSAAALAERTGRRSGVLRRVLDEIARCIPAEDGPRGEHEVPLVESMNEVWDKILPVPGIRHPAPAALVEAKEAFSAVLQRAPHRLGTLGGRRHFLELQADDQDRVWIVAHAGSRGLGAAVCTLFDGLAADANERWHSWVPGRAPLPGPLPPRTGDLAFLPADVGDGPTFLGWASFCSAFAVQNRAHLIAQAEAILFAQCPGERTAYVDTPHTFVQSERHEGRLLVVHRKGAARADAGTTACIAESALAGNWIVEGLADDRALSSVPSGLGRAASRATPTTPGEPLTRQQVRRALADARERTLTRLASADVEVAAPDGALLLDAIPNTPDDAPADALPASLDGLARPLHHLRSLGLYRA